MAIIFINKLNKKLRLSLTQLQPKPQSSPPQPTRPKPELSFNLLPLPLNIFIKKNRKPKKLRLIFLKRSIIIISIIPKSKSIEKVQLFQFLLQLNLLLLLQLLKKPMVDQLMHQ